jgi:hypothetical protein
MMIRFIKRHAIAIALTLGIAPAALLASCNSKPEAINRMVKELNSPQFKAKEMETGLFTDSSAKLDGDTLTLTFFCRPELNLSSVTPDKLPTLRESAVQEFKTYLSDRSFKEGIEALRDNGMSLRLIWQDTAGKSVSIDLPPAEILGNGTAGS